jgi:flagellar biosynthesis protein FliP
VNSVDLQVNGIGAISAPLPIILLLTLISFLPAILVTMTCFTRITIVFTFCGRRSARRRCRRIRC